MEEGATLEIQIHAKNLELNSDAEAYIQKKFTKLQRHLNAISDATLEVSRTSARSQSDRFVAQMTITAGGYILRGQEPGLNLFAAVDAVTDVLDRQIQRYKGKIYRSSQAKKSVRTASAIEGASTGLEEPDTGLNDTLLPSIGRVVRIKRFPMKPMTVEDAILEMELLSHDFFLFYNVDAEMHNVVYRRHDDDYGLIQPEPA